MDTTSERTIKTIMMNEGMYHQARVAAVMSRRGLGEWLEEAIREKLERDRPLASLALEGEGHGSR